MSKQQNVGYTYKLDGLEIFHLHIFSIRHVTGRGSTCAHLLTAVTFTIMLADLSLATPSYDGFIELAIASVMIGS